MDYKNLTGWNLAFSDQGERGESCYSDDGNVSERPDHTLKVPSGLHCGPAGRRTLIKWLEDNYKLSRGINNANPGVMACRLWQESQGLPDEVSKAIVGLLKLQGIPTNVTYKVLFENYLAKHLCTLMKRHARSQKRLSFLADKMVAMFQVTQIQPLIVNVLDLLVEIPQSAMSKILEDTASSHHFYKICTLNIKRKIWAACPERLYETMMPLIYKSLFLLRLGVGFLFHSPQIFDDGMGGSCATENLSEYNKLIAQMVQLIGDPQSESSRIVYCQIVTILKLLFIKSSLQYKTNLTRAAKGEPVSKSNGDRRARNLNVSKNIDCNLCFKNERFSHPRPEEGDLNDSRSSSDGLSSLYLEYTGRTIGLSYSFTSSHSDPGSASAKGQGDRAGPDVQYLNLNIDEDLLYPDRGEPFYSTIRYSVAMKLQEMYKVTNADMRMLEPNFNMLQLVSKVHNSVDNALPTSELMAMMNKKNLQSNVYVKDDMDLFNIAFILCNPIMYKIVSYYVHYLFNMDVILLTSKLDIGYWLSLLSLGLSCSYISVVKFILDTELEEESGGKDQDPGVRKRHLAFFKPYINLCKPVSLKKLLYYVHPVDKDNKLATSQLPPFFANFISPSLLSQDAGGSGAFRRLSAFEMPGEVGAMLEDDPDMTFHSLLILYLPKLDTHLISNFKNACRDFLSQFHYAPEEEGDGEGRERQASSREVDFSTEETRDLVTKVLQPFNHSTFNSHAHLDHLMTILNRHFSSTKRAKPSTIGQLNFTLLHIVMKKLSTLSHTTMNMLSSTANITNLLSKLVALEVVRTTLESGGEGSRSTEGLLRFISNDRFKKETVVNFKTPTDYLYLRLLRIIMFSDSVKPAKDVVFKFVENVSNYSVSTSFILLYYYKKYGKDKNAAQTLDRLSRNCHRILYDKENKSNPSYQYKKWTLLFEELKQALE